MNGELVNLTPIEVNFVYDDETVVGVFNQLQKLAHARSYNAGWWHDIGTAEAPGTMEPFGPHLSSWPYVIATKIALTHSELSEGLEGYRTDKMDDKLPHRPMIECEIADAVLRLLDLGEALDLDVIGAILEKSMFNTSRPDHAVAKRLEPGGKKF